MSATRARELERRYAMPTYLRADVEFVRGEGSWLWDSEGREYLDFFSGLAVHNFGHCNPRIVAAIRDQVATFMGSSNLFLSEPAMELSERLSESSLGGRVFLCNTGAEASECAIKLVRKHAHLRGIDSPEVVTLDGAFHGRTMGALAATPKLAREDFFGPLPRGFTAVPRDDADALRSAVGERTAAVMIEPVQGEAGVFPIADEVLAAAREACERTGALLVFDEVQSGVGRTGTLWAHEATPVRPDVMTAAKALGGGLPVGAVVTRPDFGEVLQPGDHGSTFAGGPVAARAALEAIAMASDDSLLESVRARGERLRAALAADPRVREVRGRGLMIGISLADGIDATRVRDEALSLGLVTNVTGPSMMRFLPPLTLSPEELEAGLRRFAAALDRCQP